jgi:hypothetical protein
MLANRSLTERCLEVWLKATLCCAVALGWMNSAVAQTPTAQELIAEQDQALVNQVARWVKSQFSLPGDLPLDTSLRQAATDMAKEHVERVRTQVPQWIAQERAAKGNPGLRGVELSQPLYFRAINELAIWSIESAGTAHDEALIKVAVMPMACSVLYSSHFSRRIAMIQTAPVEARPALLEGEQELLARWGSTRNTLPERPSTTQFGAANQAITRLRTGLPIDAEPMTAFLAGLIFARDSKPGLSERWEQCAKSQWWLASQLKHGNTDRAQALTLYRYSNMVGAQDFVPDHVAQKVATNLAAGTKSSYPPVATYFQVEGVTTVQSEVDELGKFIRAQVVSRKLKVPGVRDNPAIAFETLLDAATLDYAEKGRTYPADKGKILIFEMVWSSSESQDAGR